MNLPPRNSQSIPHIMVTHGRMESVVLVGLHMSGTNLFKA